MSHLAREKLDLVNRTEKVIGQLESVLRELNDDGCAEVLLRRSARGAIHSLTAELTGRSYPQPHAPQLQVLGEAADDVIRSCVPT